MAAVVGRRVPARPAAGDAGQVATAVMLLVAVALVAVVALGVVRLGGAADERAQAQTAADAAALAGAEQIRLELALRLLPALRLPADPRELWPAGCRGVGQEAAIAFAGRNGARVTGYCWDPARDRIEVSVENLGTRDTRATVRARASATARLGLGPAVCELDGTELRCPRLTLPLDPLPDDLGRVLEDTLEPALTSSRRS